LLQSTAKGAGFKSWLQTYKVVNIEAIRKSKLTLRQLVLENSRSSSKALRILKNNTGPTTIWNY
jgi:hypothetical protein